VKQHLHILREGTGAEVKEFFGERCRFEQARARRRRAVQPHAALLRGSSEGQLSRPGRGCVLARQNARAAAGARPAALSPAACSAGAPACRLNARRRTGAGADPLRAGGVPHRGRARRARPRRARRPLQPRGRPAERGAADAVRRAAAHPRPGAACAGAGAHPRCRAPSPAWHGTYASHIAPPSLVQHARSLCGGVERRRTPPWAA